MWRLGGRGPDAYDCWGLLRECRERYFEGGIPETALGEQARALYAHKMRTGAWKIVTHPQHGDGVMLRAGNDPHVGIYLDLDGGGVLHALEGRGVIFSPMRALFTMGFLSLSSIESMPDITIQRDPFRPHLRQETIVAPKVSAWIRCCGGKVLSSDGQESCAHTDLCRAAQWKLEGSVGVARSVEKA